MDKHTAFKIRTIKKVKEVSLIFLFVFLAERYIFFSPPSLVEGDIVSFNVTVCVVSKGYQVVW